MIAAGPFSFLFTVGEQARWMADEAEKRGMDPGHIRCCSDREEALDKLKEILRENDRILLKASRGMGLERIAEALKAST
jgi:UDP-N-acetylmuramoyl-tripeptide--D-alanyl-D-alanine ligase